MNEEQTRYFRSEINHAIDLLAREQTFDNISDASAVLAKAANRLAPPGHSIRVVRDRLDLIEDERLSVTREF